MSTYPPIPLAGSQLRQHRHVCAFFNTLDEEYRVMLPFVRDAIEQGERSVNLMPDNRTDYVDRLRHAGIDVERARAGRQLRVMSAESTDCVTGQLDVEAMLLRILTAMQEGRALGFRHTRLTRHGTTALIDPGRVHSILEYEARLTGVVALTPGPVVCVYDLNLMSAAMALDVMRTHPMTIVGGVLQENPFYVPPDQYLKELRRRRATAQDGVPGERMVRPAPAAIN